MPRLWRLSLSTDDLRSRLQRQGSNRQDSNPPVYWPALQPYECGKINLLGKFPRRLPFASGSFPESAFQRCEWTCPTSPDFGSSSQFRLIANHLRAFCAGLATMQRSCSTKAINTYKIPRLIKIKPYFTTEYGKAFLGDSSELMKEISDNRKVLLAYSDEASVCKNN